MQVRFDFTFDKEDVVFDGKFIKTTTEQIGNKLYERTYLGSGVVVIPFRVDACEVLLIKERRIHHGEHGEDQWKLITGWKEERHTSFLQCAQEECLEEVGGESDVWVELYDAHHRATISSRKVYFLCVDPVFRTDVDNPDGDIVLDQQWVNEAQLWDMLWRREVMWTRDMLAVFIAMRNYTGTSL